MNIIGNLIAKTAEGVVKACANVGVSVGKAAARKIAVAVVGGGAVAVTAGTTYVVKNYVCNQGEKKSKTKTENIEDLYGLAEEVLQDLDEEDVKKKKAESKKKGKDEKKK